MFSKVITRSFVTVGRCQVLLEQEISISIMYGNRDIAKFGVHHYILIGYTEEKIVMAKTSDCCLLTWCHIVKHQHQGVFGVALQAYPNISQHNLSKWSPTITTDQCAGREQNKCTQTTVYLGAQIDNLSSVARD